MGRILVHLAAWFCLGVAPWAEAQTIRNTPVPSDKPIPDSDFVRPHFFSDPQENYAGTAVVSVITFRLTSTAIFYDIPNGRVATVSVPGSGSCHWITNNELCFKTRDDLLGIYKATTCVDWRSINWEQESIQDNALAFFASRPSGKSFPDVFWQDSYEANAPDIPGEIRIAEYSEHLTGLPAALVTQRDGVRRVYRYESKRWIDCLLDPEKFHLLDAGDRPGEAIVSVLSGNAAPPAVCRINLVTKQLGEVLARDSRYEASGVVYSADGRRIVGINYDWAQPPKTVWLDPKYQAEQSIVQRQIPGADNLLLQADATGQRFLVKSLSDRQPPVYYFADLSKSHLQLIRASAPWIDPKRTTSASVIRYQTQDGITLDGTLFVPSGISIDHPGALIVLLDSDSPSQSAGWGWNDVAQMFSQWGYAVFLPSNRASDGLSWQVPSQQRLNLALLERDYGDGVRYVLRTGLIDPSRVGLAGEGTGTAQALSLAINQPDLARCVIAMPGLCDVEEFVKDHQIYMPWMDMEFHFAGYPWVHPEAYAPIEPLRRITQLKAPVCLVDFTRFRYEIGDQLTRLRDVLHSCGHDYTFIHGRRTSTFAESLKDTDLIYSKLHRFLTRTLPIPSPAQRTGTGPNS